MQFKIIPQKILCINLNDFLMNHYSHSFEQLKNFVFLDISLERFNSLKAGQRLKLSEILELTKKFNIGNIGKKTEILKKAWSENENLIFREIKSRTNLNLSTDKMICYLDPYTRLGFYSEGKSITISSELPIKDSLMVITHEIFHICYWNKVFELGLSDRKNLKKFEWDLSEVTVYFLLKERNFNKFWSNININLYPNIIEVYEKVKNIWPDSTFDNYLLNSYRLLNQNE